MYLNGGKGDRNYHINAYSAGGRQETVRARVNTDCVPKRRLPVLVRPGTLTKRVLFLHNSCIPEPGYR